jgi:hypothetical protein
VVILLLFGAAPAVAVVVLAWALLSQGTGRTRIVELVVLGLIALPLASAYVYGINADVTAALASPPPLVAAAHTGCGPSAPSATIVAP